MRSFPIPGCVEGVRSSWSLTAPNAPLLAALAVMPSETIPFLGLPALESPPLKCVVQVICSATSPVRIPPPPHAVCPPCTYPCRLIFEAVTSILP